MAPTFHVREPHPSVSQKQKTSYISSGRGGAGNVKKYNPSTLTPGATATGPASRAVTSTTTSNQTRRVFSGIGGAGNARPLSERRMFSFDEELERQQRLADAASATPVFHIGRGGAGNAVLDNRSTSAATGHVAVEKSRQGSAGSETGSVNSAGSEQSGVERAKRSLDNARARLARALSRE